MAAWTLFWTLFGAKLATILLIWWMAPGDASSRFLLATNWLWLLLLGVAIAIPGAYWLRLLKARSKRRALLRQEWQVDETPAEEIHHEELFR
ncbi:MAG: hypothetical protein IT307_05050 [Chloroflexi bacterium]|nr:hypothetical protein [Chloroflexota bacterium]